MSSYLAALVVGNFEYIEGEADGIPIRVYSTPGKKDMGQFALASANTSLATTTSISISNTLTENSI